MGKSLRPDSLAGLSEDLSLFAQFTGRRGYDGFRIDVNLLARREGSFDIIFAYEIHRAMAVALALINRYWQARRDWRSGLI